MKTTKIFLWLWAMMAATMIDSSTQAQTTSVMTYNIRFDNPGDGENNWHQRKAMLAKQVLLFEPDFLGTQEALEHQLTYLDEQLEAYAYLGVGRDDGKSGGEFSALFYQKEKFEVLDSGTFWLSETPSVPSKGWDAAIKRVCSYGQFKSKGSAETLWVFNTHFDHVGTRAREESARLIMEKVKKLTKARDKVVIMGDLNLTPDAEPIRLFSEQFTDARHCIDCLTFGTEGTFNGFKVAGETTARRIDYIFVSGSLKVNKYAVLSDLVKGRFISDHFPVYVELTFD